MVNIRESGGTAVFMIWRIQNASARLEGHDEKRHLG